MSNSALVAIQKRLAIPTLISRPAGAPGFAYTPQQQGDTRQITTEDMAVRALSGAWDQNPQFRPNMPELATSDVGNATDPFVVDGARLLSPWYTDLAADSLQMVKVDYPMVGSVATLRSNLDFLYAMGVLDDTAVTAAQVGATPVFKADLIAAGPSVGFRLDWGVSQLTFQPFDLVISTAGWKTGYFPFGTTFTGGVAGVQPSADRTFTIRVRGGINGGSVFVPWAYRPAGMSYALNTIACVPAAGEGSTAPITVSNVPSNMVSAFGFNVRLLTAGSVNTAALIELAQAYGS